MLLFRHVPRLLAHAPCPIVHLFPSFGAISASSLRSRQPLHRPTQLVLHIRSWIGPLSCVIPSIIGPLGIRLLVTSMVCRIGGMLDCICMSMFSLPLECSRTRTHWLWYPTRPISLSKSRFEKKLDSHPPDGSSGTTQPT